MKFLSQSIGILTLGILASGAQAQSAAITAVPISNINVQGDSDPANLTQVDGKLFFTAKDKIGPALFVKNLLKGTGINPKLDTAPTLLKRLPNSVDQFVVKGPAGKEQLYFHVLNSGLWTSRGTPATTVVLKKVDQITPLQIPMSFLTTFNNNDPKNGRLFFAAIEPAKGTQASKGYELWSSNGTATGTKLFKDLNANGAGNIFQISSIPYQLVDVKLPGGNERLVFGAGLPPSANPNNPFQLWASDGTAQNPTTQSPNLGTYNITTTLALEPDDLTGTGSPSNPGGHCYFSASGVTDTGTRELWITDGSTINTVCVTNGAGVNPTNLAAFGGGILFAGQDSTHGNELWISQESDPLSTTTLLADINLGSGDSNPRGIVNAGNKFAYFIATPDGTHSYLYRTDGTPGGTSEVFATDTTLSPATANLNHVSNPVGMTPLLDDNGTGLVFFAGDDGNGNRILWQTNNVAGARATPATTPQGNAIVNPSGMTAVTLAIPPISRLYFSATVAGSEFGYKGTELWVYQVQ